jgi:transposase
VARTDAPVGHTPILKAWRTREPLAASSAISPEGKRYVHCQEGALNSADVVAFLEHLRRAVPGRLIVIGDGAPIHRSRVLTECLANGARQRLHVERLPASAPDLNPGEGLWAQLKGVELRHGCGFSRTHLRQELRDAVKRVRRQPRMIKGCFAGAKL